MTPPKHPGDGGRTRWVDGPRVRKDHPRIAALGDLDELSCWLGLCAADSPGLMPSLSREQDHLFELSAALAAPRKGFGGAPLAGLEADIARWGMPRGFQRPASRLHLARAVCRRAERSLAALGRCAPPGSLAYLNRLSLWLFSASGLSRGQLISKSKI
jgi:cob(I)alamin adenosyltransferase